MIRFIALLFITFHTFPICTAQTRRALLIGISRYDTRKTQWNPIHGTNDVALLKVALTRKGVKNIIELRDSHATYNNICKSFNKLINQTLAGDIIYIHLSGHGQPVEDYDGDESNKDCWDEAFIPYDAAKKYEQGVYEGEHHLTDDILNKYIEQLRLKAGGRGMVYISIDACHAGDSYRDKSDDNNHYQDQTYDTISSENLDDTYMPEWSNITRGSSIGFSRNGKLYSASDVIVSETNMIKRNAKKASVVIMESCLSTQQSYELKLKMKGQDFYCGPLSYVLYKEMISNDFFLTNNASWVKRIKSGFSKILPHNNPQKLVIETTEKSLCY